MATSRDFIDPILTSRCLDIYTIRKAIFAAVKHAAPLMSGTLVDVGCGEMPYRDFILGFGKVNHYLGLDLADNDNYSDKCDLSWDGTTVPLPASSVDCAMATEVLEHCPEPDKVLEEIFRILQPGGLFFFTVPFLWPLHDLPNDHYRFTPFALGRHLGNAGFVDIRLQSLGGWDCSLAQMLGLYLRRRPMPGLLRAGLSLLALPVVHLLATGRQMPVASRAKSDLLEDFSRAPMTIGISGIAYKPHARKKET